MNDIDIARSVENLVKEHGIAESQKLAAGRADGFAKQGDVEGFTLWTRILLALLVLDERERSAADPVN